MYVISVFVPTMATPQGSKTRRSISYLCDDKYKDMQKDAKKCLAIMDNPCGIKMVPAILSKPLPKNKKHTNSNLSSEARNWGMNLFSLLTWTSSLQKKTKTKHCT